MNVAERKQLERMRREVALFESFRSGDPAGQKEFYAMMRDSFRRCHRWPDLTEDDIDDLFQDSFLILWEKIDSRQIFVECGSLVVNTVSGIEPLRSLEAYFMKVVRNRYFLMMRHRVPVDGMPEDMAEDMLSSCQTLLWDEDPEIVKDRILSMQLRGLPKGCRRLLTDFYYLGKPLGEILESHRMAVEGEGSYRGLKTRKSKCLSMLRTRVTKAYEEYRKAMVL